MGNSIKDGIKHLRKRLEPLTKTNVEVAAAYRAGKINQLFEKIYSLIDNLPWYISTNLGIIEDYVKQELDTNTVDAQMAVGYIIGLLDFSADDPDSLELAIAVKEFLDLVDKEMNGMVITLLCKFSSAIETSLAPIMKMLPQLNETIATYPTRREAAKIVTTSYSPSPSASASASASSSSSSSSSSSTIISEQDNQNQTASSKDEVTENSPRPAEIIQHPHTEQQRLSIAFKQRVQDFNSELTVVTKHIDERVILLKDLNEKNRSDAVDMTINELIYISNETAALIEQREELKAELSKENEKYQLAMVAFDNQKELIEETRALNRKQQNCIVGLNYLLEDDTAKYLNGYTTIEATKKSLESRKKTVAELQATLPDEEKAILALQKDHLGPDNASCFKTCMTTFKLYKSGLVTISKKIGEFEELLQRKTDKLAKNKALKKQLSQSFVATSWHKLAIYLEQRNQTYKVRDFFGRVAAFFLGCFGFETEKQKRTTYINEKLLPTLAEYALKNGNKNSKQALTAVVDQGLRDFSPRANKGVAHQSSLHFFLTEANAKLNKEAAKVALSTCDADLTTKESKTGILIKTMV